MAKQTSWRSRQAPERGDVPAELLASWAFGAGSGVWSALSGKRSHTMRIEGSADWDLHSIPKPRSALKHMASWRPLCNCVSLFKQYDRLLWAAAQRACRLPITQHFGFTTGSEGIRGILRQAHEWGHKVYIASLDADKAFGQLEAYAVQQALLEHDAPACAIAAVLKELVAQRAWPSLAGVSCDTAFAIADDPIQLQSRCRAVVHSGAVSGIPFSGDPVEILSSADVNGNITNSDGRRFAPMPKLKIFGVAVDGHGGTAAAISAREQAAAGVCVCGSNTGSGSASFGHPWCHI